MYNVLRRSLPPLVQGLNSEPSEGVREIVGCCLLTKTQYYDICQSFCHDALIFEGLGFIYCIAAGMSIYFMLL